MNIAILFLYFNLYFVSSRFCTDSKKGICEVDDLGGWCYHNITSNEYSCDDNNFCTNKENLKGRTNFGGCYKSGDSEESTECCCNKGELCNLAMMVAQSEGNDDLQKCYYANEKSNEETVVYKECVEPYCLVYMEKDVIGTTSRVFHGCESKTIFRYKTSKIENDIYGNNTNWDEFEKIVENPRCSRILDLVEPNENGTKIGCIDTNYVHNGIEKKGKYCCCKGTDFCNEGIHWSHQTVSFDFSSEINSSVKSKISTLILMIIAFIIKMSE
uniref:Myristylated protein n=1 Tax=Parastrongyloides trichosuri TaxID=131310 RepID=A0A0N4ZMS4_PARTI